MVFIRSRVLSSRDDLSMFVDNYNQGSNKRKVEDLEGSFVRAFYYNGLMVGGYSINNKPPFFHLDMIPTFQRDGLGIEISDSEFTEVRSLWIKRSAPNTLRAAVYCRSVLDAASTKPKYILGGTFTEPYRKTQMRALPRLIYYGEVDVWSKKQVWWIFCGRPIECIARLPVAVIGGWLDRKVRKK